MDTIVRYLASFLAVLVVLSFHEFGHAFVAYKCGDPTPKWNGRLTLNPIKHFDVTGLIAFVLIGFGWAKPVPINPNNFRNYKRGLFLTALAGVAINLIMAFCFYPLFLVASRYIPNDNYLFYFIKEVLYLIFAYSLSFSVFNLLPFYPLDGFRVVEALSVQHGKVYQFLRKYGYYILMGLVIEGFFCSILEQRGFSFFYYIDILGYVMKFATGIIGFPITAFWGLFL